MQRNIETALRNAKHIEVPDSTFNRVENVLRSLEERKDITNMKPKYRKQTLVAAIVAVSFIALSTVALAYTGVLSGLFSAITDGETGEGGLSSETRKAIVEHDHVAIIEQEDNTEAITKISMVNDGSELELNAYFVDEKEIWFNFTLSNADIPDGFDPIHHQVLPGIYSLEITQKDGSVLKWEDIVDENGERRTFPGGHSYIDWSDYSHGGEHSEDSIYLTNNNKASFNDDGSLEITIVGVFSSMNNKLPDIGDNMRLQLGNFMFNMVEWERFVEGADNSEIISKTWLNGMWEFKIDIDRRFADTDRLNYNVANIEEAARHGIIIHSVTVLPSATIIETSIDFSKNELMTPPNDAGDDYNIQQNIILNATAVSETAQYKTISSNSDVNGNIRFELESMYFEAPENLTLVFGRHVIFAEIYDEVEIRIPVKLVR
ncbi:MAG: hypothetical protein FWD38_11625 [Oscillospiraceae bacterium]|nr:hypothetical protein [Oscillospiraceae bacterium]